MLVLLVLRFIFRFLLLYYGIRKIIDVIVELTEDDKEKQNSETVKNAQ